MIYLATVTLINDNKDKITSDIIINSESINSNSLSEYQKSRALHYAGIDKKTKTKYDKWIDSRLFSIKIIKQIKGIA
jgi:hypothetical protein